MPFGSHLLNGTESAGVISKVTSGRSGGFGSVGPVPYPQDNRYVRIVGKLLKFNKSDKGQETLAQNIPLIFTVPVVDKGPYDTARN
jgi:hypothetical protein